MSSDGGGRSAANVGSAQKAIDRLNRLECLIKQQRQQHERRQRRQRRWRWRKQQRRRPSSHRFVASRAQSRVRILDAIARYVRSRGEAGERTAVQIVKNVFNPNFLNLQVEMSFVAATTRKLFLRIRAPNGECSPRFAFSFDNESPAAHFSPQTAGCGHGIWRFEIEPTESDAKTRAAATTESSRLHTYDCYLDGVGSLIFEINDQLDFRLKAQEFLRLPSASQCCSSSAAAQRRVA